MTSAPTPPGELHGFDAGRLRRIDTHLARYVDDGRLAGWQVQVSRHGDVVHSAVHGLRDREAGLPVEHDTLWRLYSMTKPVTSIAAMALWEQGLFELTDPISTWLPEFASMQVYDRGSDQKPFCVPATEPIRMWHLLTHTSGLTYGFTRTTPVDAMYRAAGYEWGAPAGQDLAAACQGYASLPLLFQPGTRWAYGVSTDVLGRVLEVVAGKPLDEVLRDLVLGPLGMTETGFQAVDVDRLAALYTPGAPGAPARRLDAFGNEALRTPRLLSGGGGLVGTAADYQRFVTMLLRGGELDGTRVLGSRTLRMMAANQLPGGLDLAHLTTGGFAETTFEGIGFGYGFATVLDPRASRSYSSPGEFYWGGAASTAFWVDPVEDVTVLLFTQLLPSSTYPLRPQLRQLVYQALVD